MRIKSRIPGLNKAAKGLEKIGFLSVTKKANLGAFLGKIDGSLGIRVLTKRSIRQNPYCVRFSH
jgi:hypothetical protein